jgi:hypothetical protein
MSTTATTAFGTRAEHRGSWWISVGLESFAEIAALLVVVVRLFSHKT